MPRLTVRSLCLLLVCFTFGACASMPRTTTAHAFARKYGDFDYCPIEVTKQTEQFSCGPACLTTVLRYWRKDASEQRLLEEYPSEQEKLYYLHELRAMAAAEGLKSYALSMTDNPFSELEEQVLKGRPLICAVHIPRHLYGLNGVPILGRNFRNLMWAFGVRKKHFVVVAGLDPDKSRLLVMDPAFGFTTFSWRHFEDAWARANCACLLVSE